MSEDAKTPVERAWAMLAVAEFENDLEHAERALEVLTEVRAEAQKLALDDLMFAALARESAIFVNRGRSAETESVLNEMQKLVDASGDPAWRAALLHERGVLVLPDFIANAGGVISAAVEYHGGTESAAFAAIAEKIDRNTRAVLATVSKETPPRAAAIALAKSRVDAATATRRWR